MSLLSQGEEGAFTELYERFWKRLLVRAQMMLNNYEEAEETVHDIFVKLWRKRATIIIEHSIHTYLSSVLRYDCFRKLADQKRKKEKALSLAAMTDADDSTREYLDFEALQKELETAISALPEQCQLIFRLSREEGLTDKQIAKELDVSVNTIRTQKHRALKKLKSSLNSFFLL
jgi:RNA polymerase sigma-70 factor (family 1)